MLVVGDDRSGLGEEARAFGGVGAVGFEDGVVNGFEFALLGGREVDVASGDTAKPAIKGHFKTSHFPAVRVT